MGLFDQEQSSAEKARLKSVQEEKKRLATAEQMRREAKARQKQTEQRRAADDKRRKALNAELQQMIDKRTANKEKRNPNEPPKIARGNASERQAFRPNSHVSMAASPTRLRRF